MTLSLFQIRTDRQYICILNEAIKFAQKIYGYCPLNMLIDVIHQNSPELKEFCEINEDKFKSVSIKDKGLPGKIVEFKLFGNLPNNNSSPDLCYGDIKTTHFKKMKKGFNAKERLTLTNFGDPSKQCNIDNIMNKDTLQETKFYEKIKKGILLIFQQSNDSIYNKKIMGIIIYDLDDILKDDIGDVFQNDFIKIKKCIIEKTVSQKGQQYLHIHKHGCKNGKTRAFGFTNKFLTKLVSIYLKTPLLVKGRSEYIEF